MEGGQRKRKETWVETNGFGVCKDIRACEWDIRTYHILIECLRTNVNIRKSQWRIKDYVRALFPTWFSVSVFLIMVEERQLAENLFSHFKDQKKKEGEEYYFQFSRMKENRYFMRYRVEAIKFFLRGYLSIYFGINDAENILIVYARSWYL